MTSNPSAEQPRALAPTPAAPAPASPAAQHGATRRNNIPAVPNAAGRFLRSRNDLTERQKNAAELMLRGLSDQQVAAQLGVDRGTVFRWRKSIPFARELDRQRRDLWDRSAAQLQSLVQPALHVLQRQLESPDERTALRAAGTLLRFATPARLLPTSDAEDQANADTAQLTQDLIAYINAPMPGEPGAPEDLPEHPDDEEDDATET